MAAQTSINIGCQVIGDVLLVRAGLKKGSSYSSCAQTYNCSEKPNIGVWPEV